MSQANLRFGLVGCGVIHSTHADALANIDGAELTAVYDVVPEAAAGAAAKYKAFPAASLDDLFARVDVVTVCVPSGLHAEIGIAAANAGKHVLVEKPIDISLQRARALVDACHAAKVKLGVISQHRFSADIQRLKDAAASGGLGRLIQGDVYNKWYRTQGYYDSGAWRGTWALDGGGCLMNQGVHYVDMLQWIMGGVKAVQAQVRTASHERIEVEDIANALIEFKNGAVGVIQGSTSVYPGLAERIEVHGLHGTVIIEGDRIKLWKVDAEASTLGKYGDGVNSQPTPSVHIHGEETAVTGAADPSAIFGNQHQLQISDFVSAVRENREPFVTGEMALEPLRVILAIYESGRNQGARVELA